MRRPHHPERLTPAAAATLTLALSTSASAQSAEAGPLDPPAAARTLQIETTMWFAAPTGKLRLPGRENTERLHLTDLNMDSPRATPYAEFRFSAGRWTGSASGFLFSASDRSAELPVGVAFGDLDLPAGARTKTSLDFWSADAHAGYRLLQPTWGSDADREGTAPFKFTLDALLGLRAYSAEFRVERTSPPSAGAADATSDGFDDFWIEPVVGARFDLELYRDVSVIFQTDVGALPLGDHQSWSWDIMLKAAYRFHPNAGLEIGYRQLVVNLTDGSDADEFKWRGSVAGLFAGVHIRF